MRPAYNYSHYLRVTGDSRGAEPLERRKSVSFVKECGGAASDKGEYMTIKATINFIKHDQDPFYEACPTSDCNKKVNRLSNGNYRCEKCNSEFPTVWIS